MYFVNQHEKILKISIQVRPARYMKNFNFRTIGDSQIDRR